MLPKSVADDLQRRITGRDSDTGQLVQDPDPAYARQIVEQLVLERGGLDREVWENGSPTAAAVAGLPGRT